MSTSREWNSLKAAWVILLLTLIARIFLSGQFLLTPEEAVYWQAAQNTVSNGPGHDPLLNGLIRISTGLFGHSETAVRLPAILALSLATIYMTLLAASMFSWHTGLHVTLLTCGILQFNLAALVISPYSLLLACWAAVCYHSSQAMHSNRITDWLFTGFWFGLGLICHVSGILLLPCIVLCFVLIKPFRTCLLYPGPWLGLILSQCFFLPVAFWHERTSKDVLLDQLNFSTLTHNIVPELTTSLQFIIDCSVLLTPVVLLLILAGWINGQNKRHLVKPDVQFLILTSLPLFLLQLVFPVFAGNGTGCSATTFVTAIILIAALHSSTRSSFKGRPSKRWIICIVTAYCITIPLVLQIAYPSLPLTFQPQQTRLAVSGWDELGKEMELSARQMPDREQMFYFSLEKKLAAELSFYIPGTPHTFAFNSPAPSGTMHFSEKEKQHAGQNALGLVSTKAAMDLARYLFDKVELERELHLSTTIAGGKTQKKTLYVIRCFTFRSGNS